MSRENRLLLVTFVFLAMLGLSTYLLFRFAG